MWIAGISGKQIGEQIGKSRSSVLGMVWRRNHRRTDAVAKSARRYPRARPKSPPKPPKPKLTVMRKPDTPAKPVGSPLTPVSEHGNPTKRFCDLGAHECSWGLDDPGPGNMDRMRVCAGPTEPGQSFCGFHRRLMVGKAA
jgi:hypothetical protein